MGGDAERTQLVAAAGGAGAGEAAELHGLVDEAAGQIVEPGHIPGAGEVAERARAVIDVLTLIVTEVVAEAELVATDAVRAVDPGVVALGPVTVGVGLAGVAVDLGVAGDALGADPREPAGETLRGKLVSKVGVLRVVNLGAQIVEGTDRLDEGPEEVRVGAAVEQARIHVHVDHGVRVIDHAAAEAGELLVHEAGAGRHQMGGGVEDDLLALDAEGGGGVLAVVRGDEIGIGPVVDRLVGDRGGEKQRERVGLPAHNVGAGLQVTDVAIVRKGRGHAGGDRVGGAGGGDALEAVPVDVRHEASVVDAGHQARGQGRVLIRDREGTDGAPAGVGDELRDRIEGGAAGGGPLGDRVARGDRVRAAVEVIVLLERGVDDRLPEGAELDGAEVAADLLLGGLAGEALGLVDRGEADGELVVDQGPVEIERQPVAAPVIEAHRGA